MIDDGWFGPTVTDAAPDGSATWPWSPRATVAFFDPDDGGPFELISRHGSLTAAEMLVPLLAHRA